jgi:hypothetical protein
LQGLYKKAIYVLEVYFKEAKQHLGFLKEQSIHYAAYIASIHLVAIRFCMLISTKHNSVAAGFSEVRSSLSHNLRDINALSRNLDVAWLP